ncbi:MAG: HNH endonuclease [Candidatus Woesearchaeota archaeon]|jgi:hypothetical protein
MLKLCLFCGKELDGNKEMYCSSKCKYYYNRDKRVKHQRIYDRGNKERKNSYEREKRRGERYNFIKRIQHYSELHHLPLLLKKFNNHCQLCSSKKRLQVHHLKYTKRIEDCMLLCEECHKKIHRKI